MTLSEILPRAASLWPEQAAVTCGSHEFTYREVSDRVGRLAAALAKLGVTAGDRVAVLHRNCHRMLEAYFAAVHAGAILVPMNHRLTAADLAYILDDTSCRVMIADDGWCDLATEAITTTHTRCTPIWSAMGGQTERTVDGPDYEGLVEEVGEHALPDAASSEDDPANIYYTSGTTGHQKGVVLTHRNISSHALATISELALSDGDTWGHVAPMFHLADAWATWAITWVGGRHVMVGAFEASTVFKTLAECEVTVTNLVPTMLNDMVNHPDSRDIRLPAFRLVMSGGASISPQLVRRVIDTFRCEYVQTYGLTETSPYLTFSLLKEHLRRLPEEDQLRYRSMTGRPALGVELRLVDEEGNDVPADGCTVGEIVARGDRITPGYWQLPDATAEAFRDGWFHTGDLATVEGEGYFNIVDRKKDVILTGGELVYSTEVENALYDHPAVFEAAVIGVADDRLGESVVAFVVLRNDVSCGADELARHCRDQLAHYKCPRTVGIVEALPKTGSGKISKRALREWVSQTSPSSPRGP
jgi:acyl-CoA synthetase (AMP-forming)/AMP-acid ligase II